MLITLVVILIYNTFPIVSNLTTYIISLLLLGASGLFSGLTLGLLSLSPFELKRKSKLGDENARKVFPIRNKGNQLLVTLLVGNVLVNSALTVLLNSIVAGVLAVVISTVLITIFGEIVPQAALKKHGLSFGAKFSPLIKSLLLVFMPISYPLGKLLDITIGSDTPDIFSKDELVKIVEEHEESEDSDVEKDELRIVENALNFGDRLVRDVMTPRKMIHSIDGKEVIDAKLLKRLHESGFSRFPVIVGGDLDRSIGVLYLRDMILHANHGLIARDVDSDRVNYIDEDELLDNALNEFIKTKHHLFIATNSKRETVGVISMEDILEEIIGQEIVDEYDRYTDMQKATKGARKAAARR